MFYHICPSCGRNLGKKEIPYEQGIARIREEMKMKKLIGKDGEIFFEKKRSELLDQLYITNICCRQRVLCHVNTEHFIMSKTSIEEN